MIFDSIERRIRKSSSLALLAFALMIGGTEVEKVHAASMSSILTPSRRGGASHILIDAEPEVNILSPEYMKLSEFDPQFPALEIEELRSVYDRVNATYTEVISHSDAPQEVVIILFEERVGVLFEKQGSEYVVKYQFPVGVETKRSLTDFRMSMVTHVQKFTGEHPVYGEELISLVFINGEENNNQEIHGNGGKTSGVQRENTSGGCTIIDKKTGAYLANLGIGTNVIVLPNMKTNISALFGIDTTKLTGDKTQIGKRKIAKRSSISQREFYRTHAPLGRKSEDTG